MDIEKSWNKALKKTEIIRSRVKSLGIGHNTNVPYILLSESTINAGDTIVRTGEVCVDKPALIVPPNNPDLRGFDFDSENEVDENTIVNFLIVRGVTLPSFRYDNKTTSLDIYEGKLSNAIKHYETELLKQENVISGLLTCPEDCWPFSLIIFIATQIARNANQDITSLLQQYRKKGK